MKRESPNIFLHHLYSRLNTELLLLGLMISPDGKKKKIKQETWFTSPTTQEPT